MEWNPVNEKLNIIKRAKLEDQNKEMSYRLNEKIQHVVQCVIIASSAKPSTSYLS